MRDRILRSARRAVAHHLVTIQSLRRSRWWAEGCRTWRRPQARLEDPFWQPGVVVETPAASLRGFDEFEDHRKECAARQTAPNGVARCRTRPTAFYGMI